MRLMTGVTLSLGVWRMRIFEFFGQPCVTIEADARGCALEKPGNIRGMRGMAVQALTLFNRGMYHTLVLFIGHLGVA